jgi:acyl-CoA thioesterase-2
VVSTHRRASETNDTAGGDYTSDTTLAALLDLLDLEPIEQNLFRGISPKETQQRVFGGQVAAQALVAATRTVEDCVDCSVHSLHANFLRPGDPRVPILYQVERLRDGRSFSTRRVVAVQHGRSIFQLSASFQVREEGLDHHDPMPMNLPAPETVPDLATRLREDGLRWEAPYPSKLLDLRPVELLLPHETTPMPPTRHIWLRTTGRMPDDPLLHACVLTYASDLYLLGTSLLPHGVSGGSEEMFLASLDHAMWFHRPFRVDEWLLYAQHTPSASGGRGFVTGSVFNPDGTLAVSVAQEGVVRPRRSADLPAVS